jgi:hypothetical protein
MVFTLIIFSIERICQMGTDYMARKTSAFFYNKVYAILNQI